MKGKSLEDIFGKANKDLVGSRSDFTKQFSKRIDSSIFGSFKKSALEDILKSNLSQLEEIFGK